MVTGKLLHLSEPPKMGRAAALYSGAGVEASISIHWTQEGVPPRGSGGRHGPPLSLP